MIDEQAKHEAFEELCGGPDRAFRLLRIYENTHEGSAYDQKFNRNYVPRIERFCRKARFEGYTDQQIEAFLNLQ